jgi:hypothetical protein
MGIKIMEEKRLKLLALESKRDQEEQNNQASNVNP